MPLTADRDIPAQHPPYLQIEHIGHRNQHKRHQGMSRHSRIHTTFCRNKRNPDRKRRQPVP